MGSVFTFFLNTHYFHNQKKVYFKQQQKNSNSITDLFTEATDNHNGFLVLYSLTTQCCLYRDDLAFSNV